MSEFQRQSRTTKRACGASIERYGGTELDCPKCGEYGKFYRMTKDARCVPARGHHLHPTVGTPMERTRLPHKWFYAMYLFSTSRHGVAAKELEPSWTSPTRRPGAWRTRFASTWPRPDGETPLGESDETYVGGRSGEAWTRPEQRPSSSACWNAAATLWRRLFRSARCAAADRPRTLRLGSTVHTDERPPTWALIEPDTGRDGQSRAGEYVSGDATSGLEGFWARLMSIHGTHVHVSGSICRST